MLGNCGVLSNNPIVKTSDLALTNSLTVMFNSLMMVTDDNFGHTTLSGQNERMFAVIREARKLDLSTNPENSIFV